MQANPLLWAVLIFAASPAIAAQPMPVSADPTAIVPGAQYRSVFSGYRPYREAGVAPWRDANDEVARVGGHMGIISGGSGHENHDPELRKSPASTSEHGQAPVRSAPNAPTTREHRH